MLKSWSIKNFKPIVDSGELQLAPVTVLAGRNSSGKSSLLQSILMIAQTLGSRLLDRPLITSSSLAPLGTFEDILNQNISTKNLIIAMHLNFEDHEQKPQRRRNIHIDSALIAVTFTSGSNGHASTSAIEASKVAVENIYLKAQGRIGYSLFFFPETGEENDIRDLNINFEVKKMTEEENEQFLQNVIPDHLYLAPYSDGQPNYLGNFSPLLKDNDGPFLVELSHFLPTRVVRKFNIAEQRKIDLIERVHDLFSASYFSHAYLEGMSLSELDFPIPDPQKQEIGEVLRERNIEKQFAGKTLNDLRNWYISLRGISGGKKAAIGKKLQVIVTNFLAENLQVMQTGHPKQAEDLEDITKFDISAANLEQTVEAVNRFFASQIRYLGPLRIDPHEVQKYGDEFDNVGIRGESAAAVYDANQDAHIEWFNPFNGLIETGSLKYALNSWMSYLQIAEQVQIEATGQRGFNWQIIHRKGQGPLPLSYVGVGVSQVLPILIMGLLSPANTLLIIEQPELHLHPYAQARLGDFFMGLAKCKKQCLIETHSENLVSQLRLHIVEAGGLEKSDCMVYFVDQDEKGAAKFEQVKISERGNILNWPEGFFDESMIQEDKITAASLRKRAKLAKHD